VDNSDHESDSQADDKLAMVVVGRDGSRSQVATWVSLPGVTASHDILLQRNL
jgi:hypothetical protein